jgi:secreted PhoX family phosphatase
MLCADPKTKEIRLFLVGPKECEITGLTFTPDQKTLFINCNTLGSVAIATGQMAVMRYRAALQWSSRKMTGKLLAADQSFS